jgi:hypothetical protein
METNNAVKFAATPLPALAQRQLSAPRAGIFDGREGRAEHPGDAGAVVECFMHMTYDREANAAYFAIEQHILGGSAYENVVIERPGRGDIVLDFGADGRLLGVEVDRR